MPSAQIHTVAVIADAHFHDLYGDYDFAGIATNKGQMTARRLWDSVRSTRVFNESYFALRAALDEVVSRNIRQVVLLGDYSDDGQIATLKALNQLLDDYRDKHGLVFTATVGNHDIFGPQGRDHGKRLLNADGSYTFVSSSENLRDEDAPQTIITDKMYCLGYPAGLQAMPQLGFFRRAGDLHWETPFGLSDRPEDRLYRVQSADGRNHYDLVDGSYLCEPEPGLWLLMIDANVFEPRNGDHIRGEAAAFVDSTNAGWNGMVRHKKFILDWMQDVASRARQQNKQLLTFSHYPVVDMLNGSGDDERQLFGETGSVKRIPHMDTANAVLATGIGVHFSGHLHINDTAQVTNADRSLINIGVPSLVAFPAAFKTVSIDEQCIAVQSVLLDNMAPDPLLNAQYQRELATTGRKLQHLINAADYGSFISGHVGELVKYRYLRKEWPKDLSKLIKHLDIPDLVLLAELPDQPMPDDVDHFVAELRRNPLGMDLVGGRRAHARDSLTMEDLLGDWYRLRNGGDLAAPWISDERQLTYRQLIDLYGSKSFGDDSLQHKFAVLLRMMDCFGQGLPSANFQINRRNGQIKACQV